MINWFCNLLCRLTDHKWRQVSTAFDQCNRCGRTRPPEQYRPKAAELSPLELNVLKQWERTLSGRKGGEVWLVAYQPNDDEEDGK